MVSNKRSVPSPAILRGTIVRTLENARAATAHWQSRRWIALLTALTALPFAMWGVGSGIVWATPATYRSVALVHAAEGATAATKSVKSPAVMEQAARSLAAEGGRNDPMAAYSLWSSVTVTPNAGPELVKLEARSADAGEARRMVLAVAQAWRTTHADAASQAPSVVYVDPPEATPRRVPDETQMALGLAGSATLCLVLCIPMLLFVERRVPVRGRREEESGPAAPAPPLLA